MGLTPTSDVHSILWFLAGAGAQVWGNATRLRCRYMRRHGRPATGLVSGTVTESFDPDDSYSSQLDPFSFFPTVRFTTHDGRRICQTIFTLNPVYYGQQPHELPLRYHPDGPDDFLPDSSLRPLLDVVAMLAGVGAIGYAGWSVLIQI
ncbi:DUF3592 domain-containing protein [Hymenobacter lapidiphilus]|uniref:DUF3592 domain-containing protein n=1 Tax=Hymenobacter lapidiphilus TaxID=2608003 RepID=A0A7Y7PM74_9BACT|nr:hypothetical protein [Hymenobacter lapidiphilus]NVO30362.1 hypothetical protein [Hymenobacter lapidiphilus]